MYRHTHQLQAGFIPIIMYILTCADSAFPFLKKHLVLITFGLASNIMRQHSCLFFTLISLIEISDMFVFYNYISYNLIFYISYNLIFYN
jgi:hypothetical protein